MSTTMYSAPGLEAAQWFTSIFTVFPVRVDPQLLPYPHPSTTHASMKQSRIQRSIWNLVNAASVVGFAVWGGSFVNQTKASS